MKYSGLGIRGLFRISILIVVVLAYLVFASYSYSRITADESKKAEASIRSEANYLCLQLESLGARTDAFGRVTESVGTGAEELQSQNPDDYQLLSDPVGDVLKGYTLAETGTVFIISDGMVVASDDVRIPIGSDAGELFESGVLDGIGASLDSDQMQTIPYRGAFDEAVGEYGYGDEDEEAYLLARQQGIYTVVIIEPTSMVYRNRESIMGREAATGLMLLIVVSIIVDRLLSFVVARRIDKTNEALERITAGDLETRVEGKGTREFKSLAYGINTTVEALQGWIAEAETRMDSELAAARAIQESVLPTTFPPYPEIPKFDVYALMNAAREVGGDFYDFFLIDDSGPDSGKLAFLVADVSGKGVPAALFMMRAKAQIQRELKGGLELSQAIQNVNAELAAGNDACMFVTMWVGVLDYETGHVDYVNAGHNPPLLWREGSGLVWLRDRSGLPLGLMDFGTYGTYSFDCSIGDKILLYSDGVTEAMSKDGELYGEERLETAANANIGNRPEALVKAVRDDVGSFAQDAEQSDDITILVLEAGMRKE
ncbi:MAG: SpoIIE family protein phosphatase [Eggerthellaceae bacterium]|nr:SpoIIE family protein phosphatase [Eggerthellaceae bacterium]